MEQLALQTCMSSPYVLEQNHFSNWRLPFKSYGVLDCHVIHNFHPCNEQQNDLENHINLKPIKQNIK